MCMNIDICVWAGCAFVIVLCIIFIDSDAYAAADAEQLQLLCMPDVFAA